jgi:hypothetical protein
MDVHKRTSMQKKSVGRYYSNGLIELFPTAFYTHVREHVGHTMRTKNY